MGITHTFVSEKEQGADPTLVSKDEWNDGHDLGDFDKCSIVAVFDGGSAAITGSPEVDVVMPAAGTIKSWTLLADASGNAVIDIWKDTLGNFPPADDDSITSITPPTLDAEASATSSTLTNWDVDLATGDILRFHLDTSSSVKRLVLTLAYTRS
jgi:hypothetical protein